MAKKQNQKAQRKYKLEKVLKFVTKYQQLPHGVDVFHDIANYFPDFDANVVFDVGANCGQSAEIFLAEFANAHIYCFEPASASFDQLKSKFQNLKRISAYQLALWSSAGSAKMTDRGTSPGNFVIKPPLSLGESAGTPIRDVTLAQLDEFCLSHHLDWINYLKIDTEGGDHEVIKGATMMLSGQRIDLVQVEAGMNKDNKKHVPFEELKQSLEAYQYYLFGIYEQVNEFLIKEPQLRRANLVFVSRRMIDTLNSPRK